LERKGWLRLHEPACFHLFNQNADHPYPRHAVQDASEARRLAKGLGKRLVPCRHCSPATS
jgi:hypothetical protein